MLPFTSYFKNSEIIHLMEWKLILLTFKIQKCKSYRIDLFLRAYSSLQQFFGRRPQILLCTSSRILLNATGSGMHFTKLAPLIVSILGRVSEASESFKSTLPNWTSVLWFFNLQENNIPTKQSGHSHNTKLGWGYWSILELNSFVSKINGAVLESKHIIIPIRKAWADLNSISSKT